RPVPDAARPAAVDARVARDPPREARVPVALLARAAARTAAARDPSDDADGGQAAAGGSLKGGTMTTATAEVDAEGFLLHVDDWNEELATEIARENGIPELSDRHWLVVRFMRQRYLDTGNAPTIRSLGKESGVPIKE